MRYICSRCKLTSSDGNLWCQEKDCPAGTIPQLLNYGDYLGDIKIVELLRVWRHCTLYKAQRGEDDKNMLFIKVANPGAQSEEYIQNEASVLRQLTQQDANRLSAPFSAKKVSALPEWVEHHTVHVDAAGNPTNKPSAYGVADHQGQRRYFFLMKYVEGEFLSDALLNTPQPWHQHVGWFVGLLADALDRIYQAGKKRLHLNLNTDVILVHRDPDGLILPLLLDMGFGMTDGEQLTRGAVRDLRQFMLPAYTPPSFAQVQDAVVTTRTDVYELSLILYEMLAGKSAHPSLLRNTEAIYESVRTHPSLSLARQDLPTMPLPLTTRRAKLLDRRPKTTTPLAQIVEESYKAGHSETSFRTPRQVSRALTNLYGAVQVKSERDLNWVFRRAGSVVAVGLSVVVLVLGLAVFVTALVR